MTLHIGKQVRSLRMKLGISLNTFAKQIGVSPAYLSNLENEKTDTLTISVLDHLQEKYNFLSIQQDTISPFQQDIHLAIQNLLILNETNPHAATLALNNLKNTLQYFLENKPSDNE